MTHPRDDSTTTEKLDTATLDALRGGLRGELLQPGDASYDAARTLYNGMIDKHPALIVRCAGVADVIAAINFAREHGLGVTVKGGGHGVAGQSLCDGGLVIDLGLMRGIRVDPATQMVRAEGGCRWRDLDHETQVHRLATTGGTISNTGIGGFTLGGGLGWLQGMYGLACDNLLSLDLVTADGQFRTASATDNQDLFWAARGGGLPGVVTSFEFQLHPVTTILGGMLLYPVERASELLRFYRGFAANAPDALTLAAMFVTAPPLPFVPAHLHGQPMIALVGCYAGALDEGEQVIQPLRRLGPALELFGPMPYSALQTMLDPAAPIGLPNYWKSETLPELNDQIIEALVGHNKGRPHPLSMIHVYRFGGAPSRVGRDATAFAPRDPGYVIHIIGTWENPADNQRGIAWVRGAWADVHPYSMGTYLNWTNDQDADKLRAAYGPNHDRLATIKRQYDPDGLFLVNRPMTRGG